MGPVCSTPQCRPFLRADLFRRHHHQPIGSLLHPHSSSRLTQSLMYPSSQAVMTKSHSLGGLQINHLFLLVLETGSPMKVPVWSGSSENFLPGFQVAAFTLCAHVSFSLCAHTEKRQISGLSLLTIRTLSDQHTSLWLHLTSITPTAKCHITGNYASAYAFWGDTIQSIAPHLLSDSPQFIKIL